MNRSPRLQFPASTFSLSDLDHTLTSCHRSHRSRRQQHPLLEINYTISTPGSDSIPAHDTSSKTFSDLVSILCTGGLAIIFTVLPALIVKYKPNGIKVNIAVAVGEPPTARRMGENRPSVRRLFCCPEGRHRRLLTTLLRGLPTTSFHRGYSVCVLSLSPSSYSTVHHISP